MGVALRQKAKQRKTAKKQAFEQSHGTGELGREYFESAATNPLFLRGEWQDARYKLARRYRGLCSAMVDDLGGSASTGQGFLISAAASAMVETEQLIASQIEGTPPDVDKLNKLSIILARSLDRLGLAKKPRDITPPPAPEIDGHTSALLGIDDDA